MPSTNTTSSGIHHLAILPSMNFSCFRVAVWPCLGACADQERAFVPFGMMDADHGSFHNRPDVQTARFSRSIDEIHSPPDLITSFERSVIRM